jgi:hypothetical protein
MTRGFLRGVLRVFLAATSDEAFDDWRRRDDLPLSALLTKISDQRSERSRREVC